MSVFSKAKSFFAAHKAARVMLAAAVILLALVLICHPHGAKTFLIMVSITTARSTTAAAAT